MWRIFLHALIVAVLTILTQIGGIAWLAAFVSQRRLPTFLAAYAFLSVTAIWIAPYFGREALSCSDHGPLQVQSWIYCVLNRAYVSAELADVLHDTAASMDREFPRTITLVLDGSFPFFDGFALLPHLSHDDGDKADIAFYYADDTGYLPGKTRSPIGYFAFEPGPTHCPNRWPTLRWGFAALQPFWPAYRLDAPRNRRILETLARDGRVGHLFVEPHLADRLGVKDEKIRFQGCRAARHDDHIHLQLR